MSKFKLKLKSNNLLGRFTIDKIYHIFTYNKKLNIVKDDLGTIRLIDTTKMNFTAHFVNVNKERKQKLIIIEDKCI